MGLRELGVEVTREHVALWDSTKKFFSQVWRPASLELDRLANPEDVIAENSIYWDVMRKTYAMGYHTMSFPKELGGQDADVLSMILITELMGWAATDLAVTWGCHTTPYAWAQFSPHPEVQAMTKAFCEDTEAKLTGCWALTEPDHGSDWLLFENKNPNVYGQVRARLDKDEYVLNGQKAAWVSNGPIANHAAVWVTLNPSLGMQGGGICIVPLNLPGITRGKPLNKLGQRALPQGEIFFEDVRIPRKLMLTEDQAMFNLYSNLQLGTANGWMGVAFAGAAMSAFEEALEYAKNRVQGGDTISNHQMIQKQLYDMFSSVEAARSFARNVFIYNFWQNKKSQPMAVHYSMAAKILSTETAFKVASQAIQIFGGNGLSKEYYIEKLFRDTRAALIEDGVNEALALGAADRIIRGIGRWNATEGQAQKPAGANEALASLTWEEFKPMVRPEPGTVKMGVMKVDAAKCNGCGICIVNCPFRCWEMSAEKLPRLKKDYACFSCYNCMVACPQEAISIADTYHVNTGVFDSDHASGTVLAKLPLEPKDAKGKPDKWTDVEKMIFERRSVRNFKPDPVPEPLIRRVIEAGRFAPSSGNGQPWKFIVITDKALIKQMNEASYNIMSLVYNSYVNDALVKTLMPMYQQYPQPGLFDPRIVLGGLGSVAKKDVTTFFDAPVIIIIAGDDRAIGGPQIQAGIAGQNMNLAAISLGLGFCWNGFSQFLELDPAFKEKLGLALPWRINTALALGYPKFKQKGIVPREFRPVTWFREGKGREMEAATPDK
jgi:alkylation response protein AidB-like acyl-CoA dehydrogenase/nitroreductase/NAD-dependent dihydropyrimidine dehydrogenase PreA subunit